MANTHISVWRRRRRERLLPDLPEMAAAAAPDAFENEPLWQALRALPQRQRAVIVLRYYEGLSEAEIADALGCRPGTVKSLAKRALDHLAKELPR